MAVVAPEMTQVAPVRRRHLMQIAGNILRSPTGVLGFTIVIIYVVVSLLAPLLVPYTPTDIDPTMLMKPPSAEHLFGTDEFGRDVFSRVLMGGRLALLITFFASLIAILWGGTVGTLLGYLGGRADEIGMRVIDALIAIPGLLFWLLVIGILGMSNWVLIAVMGFTYGIGVTRVARATTLDFVVRDFITAARARGERKRTILSRELLPNILDVLLVEYAMRLSWMLLAFSSLSFLGFGVQPPTPDWGLMISESRDVLAIAPWASLAPLAALCILVVGIHLAADALSKAVGLDRVRDAPQ